MKVELKGNDLVGAYALGKYDGIGTAETILAVAISQVMQAYRGEQPAFDAVSDVKKIFRQECARYRADINTPVTEEQKRRMLLDGEPRYFVDVRVGCAAVRDRLHKDYDKDYPGLHSDTVDVVKYIHGHQDNGEWMVTPDQIKHLYEICENLNAEEQKQELLKNTI